MEKGLARTNSICPTPEDQLLTAVKKNNCEEIRRILEANDGLLSHLYLYHENRTILVIACTNFDNETRIEAKTIQTLLECGANILESNTSDSNYTALHFASYNKRSDIIEVITKLKPNDINVQDTYGNNALHTLINEGCYKKGDGDKEVVKCVKLLIEAGINVNQTNSKGRTPIFEAARNGYSNIVKAIIENAGFVDLDSYKFKEESARDLIIKKGLYDSKLPEENGNLITYTDKENIFNYLKNGDENGFKSCNISKFVNADDSCTTLLQLSCEKGLLDATKHLLANGADISTTTEKNRKKPIEIAAEHGYFEIFELLLEKHKTDKVKIPDKTLIILLSSLDYTKTNLRNFENCYKNLIKTIKENPDLLNINYINQDKNNALHYAIRYASEEQTRELLQMGASLAVKNDYGIMPIQDIDPDVLEKHLDDCIDCDLTSKALEKEDFKISFNLQSLVPPSNCSKSSIIHKKTKDDYVKVDVGDESESDWLKNALPETEVLLYMSGASEFKHLLKHPVIVTFLFMKWHRIRWLFRVNVAFYITFFLSLIFYALFSYANFQKDDQNNSLYKAIANISYSLLIVSFVILAIRELFQAAVSPKSYLKNFENYIEVILIILTGLILGIDSPANDTRKQLSSISILLAAFELVLMVGQHPKLSTNVEMLRTVSYNFFKLLLWYSILIVAFVLSFYIMFTGNDSEENSFGDPGKSFFKTIIMLTGEFDASSINFNTVLSKIIFCVFIFMITIILLNLLNGLAVNDTQMIKNDAELVGHIARTKHINYVEKMLLGNVLPTTLLQKIESLCCCLPSTIDVIVKPFPKSNCLLKKYFKDYKILVYLNKQGYIKMPTRDSNNCSQVCSNLYLDEETIGRTKYIIQQKREKQKNLNQEFCESCMKLMENILKSQKTEQKM